MTTHALIDGAGTVVNVMKVSADGLPKDWPVPEGFTLVRQDGGKVGGRWTGEAFDAPPEPEPPPPPEKWEVRKLLILDRLALAGLFSAAMAALGGPGDLNYERWSAASAISSDDPAVRQLLAAISADPDAILAAE